MSDFSGEPSSNARTQEHGFDAGDLLHLLVQQDTDGKRTE
jgi:hypothetical protein